MNTQNRKKLPFGFAQGEQATSSMLQGHWAHGQILLILVMIMAIAMTIVLTITFTSRTDTQLTKLEEESQKALAAAEAGVENTLKNGTAISNLEGFNNLSQTISSGKTTVNSAPSNVFESPTLQTNEAYTLYLGTYTPGSPPTIGPVISSNVTICFGEAGAKPALDIALVRNPAANPNVLRYAVSSNSQITNSDSASAGCGITGGSNYSYSYTISGSDVGGPDTKFLVIRSLFANTKLLISKTGLPAQGQTVSSQATTKTGVTKSIQLFQSYPQIPAEFFSTSF